MARVSKHNECALEIMSEWKKMAFHGATFIDCIATLFDTYFGVYLYEFLVLLPLLDDILQPQHYVCID